MNSEYFFKTFIELLYLKKKEKKKKKVYRTIIVAS